MPIDRAKAVGAELGESTASWAKDDVILYHLGLGAGVPQTDPNELEYCYEKNLKVLPSFVTVAGGRSPAPGGGGMGAIPGVSFNPRLLLHGEQDIELHQPLPAQATVKTKRRVADVFDKGKAALLILETLASDEAGKPLYTNRMSLFLRGEGGFGGPSGPKIGNEAPDRKPDAVVERKSFPQQALLYRLSGDKNPLHCDPDFAKGGGFDLPISHGLCSYGMVCKAVVDHALKGDVTRVARYQARFAGVAFPGETHVVSYWKEGNQLLVQSKSKERDAVIISNAAITLRG
jgi:acyl dehydratase